MFIALIDEDRSGTIDFREFLILISQRLNEKNLLDEIIEAFKVFDKDQDGFLTRSDCKILLMSKGYEDMEYTEDMLDKVDNGEGLICCKDLAQLLLATHIDD